MTNVSGKKRPGYWALQGKYARRYWDLCLIFIPVIAYYVIFKYIPMYGVLIAFKDYKLKLGIFGSPWVGFKHFQSLFTMGSFYEVLWNTVKISLLKIIFGFPAPILLALMLNEIKCMPFKKVSQTITYLPHFLSWVVLAGIFTRFLSPSYGPLNAVIKALGGSPVFFLGDANVYVPTIVVLDIWKGIGWGSIIYMAAIAGISPDLYESAMLDGASRLQRIRYITLPCILPTVTVLLILRMGGILNGGFDQIVNTYNDGVLSTADIIDTYVYRRGLNGMQFSFSSAVELFKTVISFGLVALTNAVANKLSDHQDGLW